MASHINNIGVNAMQYFVLDAMGPTAALTDTSGNTLERDYYDPWGKRRNANGSADTSCALTSATTRGFSGHEMMDSICMTNMNGRIYDQYLGRFASADTVVGNPGNGQDYNPYSYVTNRPTVFTDPTGKVEEVVVTGTRKRTDGDLVTNPSAYLGLTAGDGAISGNFESGGGPDGQKDQKDKKSCQGGNEGGVETVVVCGTRIKSDIGQMILDFENFLESMRRQKDPRACQIELALGQAMQTVGNFGQDAGVKMTIFGGYMAATGAPVEGVGAAPGLAVASAGSALDAAGTAVSGWGAVLIWDSTGDVRPAFEAAIGIIAGKGAKGLTKSVAKYLENKGFGAILGPDQNPGCPGN